MTTADGVGGRRAESVLDRRTPRVRHHRALLRLLSADGALRIELRRAELADEHCQAEEFDYASLADPLEAHLLELRCKCIRPMLQLPAILLITESRVYVQAGSGSGGVVERSPVSGFTYTGSPVAGATCTSQPGGGSLGRVRSDSPVWALM